MKDKELKHVAIIMDGNGRWAKANNKARLFGHKAGVKRVNEIVEYCINNSTIEILTLYTFSSENWSRPKIEVSGLMNLIISTIDKEIKNLIDNGVKINIIGDVVKLPKLVRNKLNEAIEKTINNDKLILNLAINYGSKQEIINAINLILKDYQKNNICLEDLSMDLFESKLYTYPFPDPDVLIRTGGEFRISNFLLWQLAYSEIIINKNFWPDYRQEDFENDLKIYFNRERRFGKTSEQLEK
tara:strand:+ start:246 stop:971 length:726 start_codon:yes stop_codon:yes gene_type:complete